MRFLLNKCINYLTVSASGNSASRFAVRTAVKNRIYDFIRKGSTYTLVRMDTYPPKKIGSFKPKLYVKTPCGFAPSENV